MSDITLFGAGIGRELEQTPRATKRALERVHGHGLIAAGKVDAAAFVAHVGITQIGQLAIEEALVVERTPHAGPRVKAVGDAFAAVTIGIVARMGYQS